MAAAALAWLRGAAAAIGGVSTAAAQVYPSRPITMIVPFPAGGPTDTIGRIIAEGMRPSRGQPIIIENIPGPSGSIATGKAARAASDGYTLSLGTWPTHVLNNAIYQLQYDALKDFDPVSLIAETPVPTGNLIRLASSRESGDVRSR